MIINIGMLRGRDSNRLKKIFDWELAAQIIVDRGADCAYAGLIEDPGTMGTILEDGQSRNPEHAYFNSTWATPTLEIGNQTWVCYKMEGEIEDCREWPESALNILRTGNIKTIYVEKDDLERI